MEKISADRDSIPILQTINTKFDQMTHTQQQIARYILDHPAMVVKMSISELTRETNAKSESAIVRFYKMLGFSGYHDFKVNLTTEIAGKAFYHTTEDITTNDNVKTVKRKMFQGTMRILEKNLTTLSDDILEEVVTVLASAKRLIFLGYGTAGIVAFDGFFKFSELGYTCHYSPDAHVNAVILATPRAGDVIFCISHSGESRDVLIPVHRAKPTAKVIALTGSAESPLGMIADICITTVSEEMNYRTDVMISRLIQLVVIDTLYITVGLQQGSQMMEQLTRTHHSLSYLKF
jgi:RpiR family carbohydrate utilization transcriptional regulator